MQETFDMIKKFLEDNKLRLAEGTLKNYGYTLNSFFVYMQKDYKTIRTKDVREWIAKLMNDGLKAISIEYKLACLKSFYSYLLDEELISKNPVAKLALPRKGNALPYYLEEEQLQKLRELVKDDPLERAIVETMYVTGVRASELIEIKLSDINWETRKIDINGKGEKERTVLFTNECELRIKKYLNNRCDNSPYLFLGKKGKPMDRFLLNYYYKKFSKKLGFKVTPNTMRHTFAAHLAIKGMPLQYIQTLLGHDNPETTRIYAKLFAHVRKKIYDRYI